MHCRALACLASLFVVVSGCGGDTLIEQDAAQRFVKKAKLSVRPEVLDDYVGTYRLPSGALLLVHREGNRLLAGIPCRRSATGSGLVLSEDGEADRLIPHEKTSPDAISVQSTYELLAQTTREFVSNRSPAVLTFDRSTSGPAPRLNYCIAKRDLWIERVDPRTAVDPTVMVDAGGHPLRLLIQGTGSPTIVIEDGFGSSIEARSELQARLSNLTRVVAYDHAGTGGSQAGPLPRDGQRVAVELRTALMNASVDPPFILVGGSIGADYMRIFTGKYSDDVQGLVLLDPTPDWDDLHAWIQIHSPATSESILKMSKLAKAAVTHMVRYQGPGCQHEWEARAATRAQAKQQIPSTNVRVTQITGAAQQDTRTAARDKVKFFDQWLREHIPHAKHVLAEKSGHAIFAAEPKLVIDEIRQLLDSIKRSPR